MRKQQKFQDINVKMDSASVKRVGIEKAQNFMRQYRDPESRELKKLSANQFMDVWSHYDKDGEKVCFIIRFACKKVSNEGAATCQDSAGFSKKDEKVYFTKRNNNRIAI